MTQTGQFQYQGGSEGSGVGAEGRVRPAGVVRAGQGT
jgi:hypothetical protein